MLASDRQVLKDLLAPNCEFLLDKELKKKWLYYAKVKFLYHSKVIFHMKKITFNTTLRENIIYYTL